MISIFSAVEARAFDCDPKDIIENEFLVRVQAQSFDGSAQIQKTSNSFASAVENLGGNLDIIGTKKMISTNGAQKVTTATSTYHLSINESEVSDVEGIPGVLSVERNCKVELFSLPNDPLTNKQWALKSIRAPAGWNFANSANDIVVAISDTGVEHDHEDLQANMWINPGETGIDLNGNEKSSNGADDDGNGYIDDIHGADIADNDGDPRPGTFSGAEHGTHVAGIVGAVGGNNIGVTGTAWNVKLMAVKGFKDDDRVANIADLIKTIYYAVDNGADVINCSWGARRAPSQAERDAFNYALSKDVIVVVASGNSTEDASNITPASIPGVVSVGSINVRSELSGFSNFGSSVLFVAPGGEVSTGAEEDFIHSTVPMDRGAYGNLRGTSMAAPFVAGTLALIRSLRPQWTPAQIVNFTKQYSDTITLEAADKDRTSGSYFKINLEKAMQVLVLGNEIEPTEEGFSFSSEVAGTPSTKTAGGGCGVGMSTTVSASSKSLSWAALVYLSLLLLPLLLIKSLYPKRAKVKVKKNKTNIR
ncbi:MAG: S8 family peptidase [Pseudobdellovibrionaceae bacterium]